MKILFITHYSSLFGANRSLLALLDGINQQKLKPYVILPASGDMVGELEERNIPYYVIPFRNWMATSQKKAHRRFIMNISVLPFLIYCVRKWGIDLIYTNSSMTPIGAWLSFLTGLPHIWHIREFGWEDYNLKYDLGKNQFEYWLNKASHLIFVSNTLKENVLKEIKTNSSVVYNGVISREEAEYLNSDSLKNNIDPIVFGIIGLLSPAKGQEQAIRAFKEIYKEYPNTKLCIAGSGSDEYEQYLIELSLELDLKERVDFLGYINDPFEFYSNIDIALNCSKNEGMGRITAEAMISERIMIGLDNAGTSELIEDERTGILYNGSKESLVSKMKYVLNSDCSQIVKNAKIKAIENFTNEVYANKVQEVIYSVTI